VAAANLSDPAAVDGLVGPRRRRGRGAARHPRGQCGITRDGLLLRMKDEDWEQVIRVNLDSYFRLSRAALKGHDEASGRADRRHHLRGWA
jgi:3-oxoacyl-[acyl-carrier protein] reductase